MKTETLSVSTMARCAMVAALYTVLCMVLAPISFGAVQIRLAEALCLLPVFGGEYILAVTLGCFLSNLLVTGFPDILFGTLATLLACLCTYALRNVRWKKLAIPASIPPVVFNALIVGPEIAYYFSDAPFTLAACVINGITVGLGEIVSCMILGVALVRLIESNPALRRAFLHK